MVCFSCGDPCGVGEFTLVEIPLLVVSIMASDGH